MTRLAEMRAVVGAVFCPTCRCDTLPLRTGICGFCDTPLTGPPRPRPQDPGTGRFVPLPIPVAPAAKKGCCLYCTKPIPGSGRYKRLYCCDTHRNAYWVTFTAKGRAWQQRHNRKQTTA